ncbi:glycosyltransferase [Bacillus sp. FJAT-44742]|uniref:glycosyltransferase n=1 Tax=Bacillus sp. FJAT-44742 TaxID=2014005 RepID=UPI000C230A63|nr:glycosyltransferase [Bacillus sp. FJAT-44742]
MLVSIITIYYNREENVIESINSLLNQSYKNIEIIAIDDGSKDNTLKRLESIKDPRLKVFTQCNQGFVHSIKKAIDYCKGKVIAIHGSGDISYKDRIKEQLNVLTANPTIGAVGCIVEKVNTINGVKSYYKPDINKGEKATNQLLKSNIFTHGEVMFRKSVYQKAGGYREFFLFSQDYDLWMRMSLISNFSIVEKVLYKRYILPNGVGSSIDKIIMQKFFGEFARQCIQERIKNNVDFLDKHGIHASFYMKKNKRLALELWQLSLTAFFNKNLEKSLEVNSLSLNQQRLIRNTLFHFFYMLLKKEKRLEKLARKIIKNVRKRNNLYLKVRSMWKKISTR